MPSPHETAYPRLKANLKPRELEEVYTPNAEELALANRIAKGVTAKVCFLVLLKTYQRLGFATRLSGVPTDIIQHIAQDFSGKSVSIDVAAYDDSGTRRRHVPVIREHLGVQPFGKKARTLLSSTVREAAVTKDDLVDIINVAIEELVRNRYELPGFTTLVKTARRGRSEINQTWFRAVNDALTAEDRESIDSLFLVEDEAHFTAWNELKKDAGAPTLGQLRRLVRELHRLGEQSVGVDAMGSVPLAKVRRFADEARSLDAARMVEVKAAKRYTLAVALLIVRRAETLDSLGTIFLKRMQKIHAKGKEALEEYRARQQGRTDELIAVLGGLVTTLQSKASPAERIDSMKRIVGDQATRIVDDCAAHSAFAGNNHYSLLWPFFKSHRAALFELLQHVELRATSQDESLLHAIEFLAANSSRRGEWLELDATQPLDLSWLPESWSKLVLGSKTDKRSPNRVQRQHFEICVFSQMMDELKSGDLCIVGSGEFADYRDQLVSWNEYEEVIDSYGEQVGLPTDAKALVAKLRHDLETTSKQVDKLFPGNASIRIENGAPILTPIKKRSESRATKRLEELVAERIAPVSILDVLADTESWLHWTSSFGPLSGHEAKVGSAQARYIATAFCYGCNLGPSQTARSLEGFGRRQIAWVNQRHVTTEKLEEAITALINAYNRFALPKAWGSGKSASADGTKWNVYEHNLLSEYHIRYGGYGGVGYYHVSDTYIALFSHFIPCGVWEAVYILDGLLKNLSEIQPDTVHADTQGQALPVFGLSFLLGIALMPRIRNWKGLTLYKSSRRKRYENIDPLFSDVIDWQLIEKHLPDMLRVVVSIRAGKIAPSTILRKLGNYSRKNRLYQAFRELGRVVRTIFLLRYISDKHLRRVILDATNKSESFNRFVQWLLFGGDGEIAENDREKQRKIIKYNHLVANCLIFHNVHSQTRILHQLAAEGVQFDREALSRLSPYITAHVNRFGLYTLDLDRSVPEPDYTLDPLRAPRVAES